MENKDYIVWKPMREWYEGKNREQIIAETDRYMDELLSLYAEWECRIKNYTVKINEMLKNKVSASDIYEVVKEQEFQDVCKIEYLFSCFSVACEIGAIEEKNEMIPHTFYAENMEEVCDRMQAVIFGLRRMEMGWEESSYDILLERIEAWHISYIYIGEIIGQHIVADKLAVIEAMAKLYERCQMHKQVILFLFYMADRMRYTEDAVVAFANTLLEVGDLYWGKEMLLKLENPSPEIKRLQELLIERLKNE